MKIKYYYEAKSQKELDYLLEYCEKANCILHEDIRDDDFINGFNLIGVLDAPCYIICLEEDEFLLGDKTTDIETFKAQFKTEHTIEGIDREVAALLKVKEELEAAQPLALFNACITKSAIGVVGEKMPLAVELNEYNNSVVINTKEYNVKEQTNSEGYLEITFHKKSI